MRKILHDASRMRSKIRPAEQAVRTGRTERSLDESKSKERRERERRRGNVELVDEEAGFGT